MYKRIIGFVMKIIKRIIMKKVWKKKKVWEGLIK
jgi:symplekin